VRVYFIHRHCAGLSKPLLKAFQVLGRPFQCANSRISQYESLLTSMKSTVTTLEKRVEELESAIVHQTTNRLTDSSKDMELEQSFPANTDPSPISHALQDHVSKVTSIMAEEKEKDKRQLNLIVHNI